jgi:hypothetical protein
MANVKLKKKPTERPPVETEHLGRIVSGKRLVDDIKELSILFENCE